MSLEYYFCYIKRSYAVFIFLTDSCINMYALIDHYIVLKTLTLVIRYTVKPVLRGHLWDKEKVAS